jgi:hypothetical protein
VRTGVWRSALFGLLLAGSLLSAASGHTTSGAQELRTCVDRWNQANMLTWGPTLARVQAEPRCTVSLAVHYRRDPSRGCSGSPAVPGHPRYCLYRGSTYRCVIDRFDAYGCPANAEGSPPLRNDNAATDERGVLSVHLSLRGTHPTPPLAWHRYPHVDGWIEPWTRSGKLRRGLSLEARQHGPCRFGSYETVSKSAGRCRGPDLSAHDPCFPQRRAWRRGELAACGEAPGDTAFLRWVISGRF